MKQPFPNKVYVMGADHHTTLSVIRCLYKCGCNIQLVIHSGGVPKKLILSHSKYAVKTVSFQEDETTIINWFMNREENEKPFIVAASDFAALIIDKNAKVLQEKYYIPGFQSEPGKVSRLMDKYQQKKYADHHDIPMAKSWVMENSSSTNRIPEDIVFPCIAKPLVSAFGSKSSIFVAKNPEELHAGLTRMTGGPILIQRFLQKKYETCAYGVMEEEPPYFRGGVIRKIHESANGSTIYAECIENEESNVMADKICRILWSEGYRGLYDFELFVCEDGVYLNEINFRASGNGYALYDNGIPAALIWCNSMLGLSNKQYATSMKAGSRHINDYFEMRNAKRLNVGILGAFKNIIGAKSRAVWDWNDLSGSIAFYQSWLAGKLR